MVTYITTRYTVLKVWLFFQQLEFKAICAYLRQNGEFIGLKNQANDFHFYSKS